MAKFLIENEKLKESFLLITLLPFPQSNQDFHNIQKNVPLQSITIFTLKRAFYKIEGVKGLKIQCATWMAEGHRGIAIQRSFSRNIV